MARLLYCPDCHKPVKRLYLRVNQKYEKTELVYCYNSKCPESDNINDDNIAFIKSNPLTEKPEPEPEYLQCPKCKSLDTELLKKDKKYIGYCYDCHFNYPKELLGNYSYWNEKE